MTFGFIPRAPTVYVILPAMPESKKYKVVTSSYQDLEQRDYQEDFKMELLGSEKISDVDHYIVQAIPTPSGPDYAKLIFWVNQENFIVSKVEYYEDELLSKTLYASDVQENRRVLDSHEVGNAQQ